MTNQWLLCFMDQSFHRGFHELSYLYRYFGVSNDVSYCVIRPNGFFFMSQKGLIESRYVSKLFLIFGSTINSLSVFSYLCNASEITIPNLHNLDITCICLNILMADMYSAELKCQWNHSYIEEQNNRLLMQVKMTCLILIKQALQEWMYVI